MTPQENIRWYWDDLSKEEQVSLLSELYKGMDADMREKFMTSINK